MRLSLAGRHFHRGALTLLLLALLVAFLIWPIVLTVQKGFERPEGTSRSSGYLLFNYDPDPEAEVRYRYAGLDPDRGVWVIGKRTAEGDEHLATEPGASTGTAYLLRAAIDGERLRLLVDDEVVLEHRFDSPMARPVGLAAADGPTRFSRFEVRFWPADDRPEVPLGRVERFEDDDLGRFSATREAGWEASRGRVTPRIGLGGRGTMIYDLPEDVEQVVSVEVLCEAIYSGRYTLDYLTSIFRDPVYMEGLRNALLVGICTTLLCLLIALPLALLAARYAFPGRTLLSALLLVPLILPPFVGAIGLQAILGRAGALNTLLADIGLLDSAAGGIDFLGTWRFGAVVLLEALHLYPIMYLNIVAAVANLDPSLEEAAQNMGAGRFRRLRKVTLPLIMPGIFAGSTIVFIWSFTELGTPLMLNFREITPVQVFDGLKVVETDPRPFALVVVMLAAAVACYAAGKIAFGGRAHAMQSKASVGVTLLPLGGIKGWAVALLFAGVTFIAVLPHLGVLIGSLSVEGQWYRSILPSEWTLSHYENAVAHPLAMTSVRNSLFLATAAMVLCVLAGLAIAYLNIRCRARLGWLLDALAMLPLAVPGIVLAFGFVAMSLAWPFRRGDGTEGFWQIVGNDPNPFPLLIIAYAVRRLPYVVRAASAGVQQTSGMLEEAALNLGASTMRTVRKIVLPLIAANLIAGGILAFSFAMLEVSDSLILAQQEPHYPITKAIYSLFNRLGDGPYIASAMGVWGMVLLTVTLAGASILMGKRMGAIFRV